MITMLVPRPGGIYMPTDGYPSVPLVDDLAYLLDADSHVCGPYCIRNEVLIRTITGEGEPS